MRRKFIAGIFFLAVLGWPTPLANAQQGEAASEEVDKPEPLPVPPAWKSVEIGNYYLKRKNYKAALSRFQEAVNTDPTFPAAYLGLGKVYEKIGLRQKALTAYQKYLDKLPSEKDAEEAKAVHRAMARLEKAIKAGPTSKATASSPSN